nr:unnamed protein product [Digitaria exilis]
MQTHAAPFPSWSPYASTFALGAHLSPAAADLHLPSEHVPDHAWNPGTHTGSHGSSGYRGNFLSLLEARNVTPEMFGDVPPAVACDYLTGVGAAAAEEASNMAGGEAAYGLGSVDGYSAASVVPPARHETASSPLIVYSGESLSSAPCYDHEVKAAGSQQQGSGATAAFLDQIMIPSRMEIQSALGYSGMGRSERERLITTESSFGVGSLPDAGLFCFSEFSSTAEPMSNNSNTHDQEARPGTGSSGSGPVSGVATTTKRKAEERVGGNAKRSKQEASRKASPPKPQAPKVKLAEKITALQQIVSPFGKTDTSSVLFETIKYINFLHEQLRLFSEPYMTKSAYKGHARFGSEGEEEEAGAEHGLRGRGLCLAPVSLTSQVYHDDGTLLDCWTPAYRSSLYYTGR